MPAQKEKNDVVALQTANCMNKYLEALGKRYKRIKKIIPLFESKTNKNSLDKNLSIIQKWREEKTGRKHSIQDILFRLQKEQKNLEMTDKPFQEYVALCAANALYCKFALEHFVAKENQDFKRGYCTSLPIQALNRQSDALINLLGEGASWQANPSELIQSLIKECPDCIYPTSEETSLTQILKDKNISTGAFVIFDLEQSKGIPNAKSENFHTMTFKNFNDKGEALCDGFANEDRNYPLGPKRQCGYVIDLEKIIYKNFEKQQLNGNKAKSNISKAVSER